MKHLLFLDIETTGLNPEKAELIELSAIRISADFTEELGEFDELAHPQKLIPPFISRLTGISNDMVKDAPDISKVHEDFKEFLHPSDVICGHNIQFDIGFLRAKGFSLPNDSLDTFPLSNILLPDEPSYSLEILAEKFNIHHKNAHRALADVKANIGLFLELKKAAELLPSDLKMAYSEILKKTKWTGTILFERAFASTPKSLFKKSSGQLSLFNSEAPSPLSERVLEKSQEDFSPHLREKQAGKKMAEMLNRGKMGIISLPPETDEISVAAEAIRIEGGGFIALPKAHSEQMPKGYFRFASAKNVFCSTAFEKWKTKKSKFTETETLATLKIIREISAGSSLIFSGLPLLREEWDVAKKWLSDDHVRCSSSCPAKKMELESRSQKFFFCDALDVTDCPAKKGVLLQSSRLARYLDYTSRVNFSIRNLEKWLDEIQKTEKDFADALLFGIGLLKRYIREKVGESPYQKFLVIQNSTLQDREIRNLTAGFEEAKKEVITLFPENTEIQNQLQFLTEYFQSDLQKNECRFITIHPDDALFFTRAETSLDGIFQKLFQEKESVVFSGKALLRRAGKYLLGEGLPIPELQEEISSAYNFSQEVHFCIPSFGGNTKTADLSVTLRLAENLLPYCSKNILALFPGAGLAESFCAEIADSAEKNGFQVLTLHGSSGKVAEQMKKGKTIFVATPSHWQKINFLAANIMGCIQHRLLFDSPADPPEQARISNVADEFLEVVLPKAIQKVRSLLGELTVSGSPFFWICLDSHFQKQGNFTDSILSALPANLMVHKMGVPQMKDSVVQFIQKKV